MSGGLAVFAMGAMRLREIATAGQAARGMGTALPVRRGHRLFTMPADNDRLQSPAVEAGSTTTMNSVAPLTPLPRRAAAADSPPRRPGAAASPLAVLIIDADPVERRSLAGIIAARGEGRFVANAFASAGEAKAALDGLAESIVVANLETVGGPQALSAVSSGRPTIATPRSTPSSSATPIAKTMPGGGW